MHQYKAGDRIGGEFTVLDTFGGHQQSGMGIVYLVENRELPFPIVLKTFQRATHDDARLQFVAEAHAWINAGAHANIVQAYWVREIAEQLFVAAEYIAPDDCGRNTLTDYIVSGQLPLEVTLWWAAQFCHGMDYARSKGIIVHRDIKPDNLMIDRTGSLKVTDFGIAKSIDLDVAPTKQRWRFFRKTPPVTANSHTLTGSAMGTRLYMAPEQFIDAKHVDHRSDIYSFGIVLYQMITGGSYPYRIDPESPNVAADLFRAHAEQSPHSIRSPLMPIIEKCLAKEPRRRFATYDALLSAVATVARDHQTRLPRVVHVAKEDEELYAKAQSYVALGDKDRALKAIEEYVSKYPDNHCGWTEKGRIHYERGEYPQAMSATKRSLLVNPYNTHAWNNLGVQLNRLAAPLAEVKHALTNALRFDPHNTAAMMNLIGPLVLHGAYGEACELAANALKSQPDMPLILHKAQSLLKECVDAKDFSAVETLLRGWTEGRPTDMDAWHNLGLFALNKGAHDQAIQCFLKVHELAPLDNFAIVQLAKLYFQKKQAPDCLRFCNLLLERNHEPLLAISLKARVLNFAGGYDRAVKFIQHYLDQNPENDALWVVLAEIHEFRDNYASAIKALQHAKRLLERTKGDNTEDNLQFINQKLQHLDAIR